MTKEKDILIEENERVERLLTIHALTPENAVFSKTPGGFVSLSHEGEEYPLVTIIRTFPFTAANEYLSVRRIDGKQEEIGMIEQLSDFDAETVALIERQLELRYFMPQILQIFSIKEEYGHTYWSVMTDKGRCRFTSASGSSGAVIQDGNRVIIKDSNQNRFEIRDITKLSRKEMKKLDLYL